MAKKKNTIPYELKKMGKDLGHLIKDTAQSDELKKLESDFIGSVKTLATDFKDMVASMGDRPETKDLNKRGKKVGKKAKDKVSKQSKKAARKVKKKARQAKKKVAEKASGSDTSSSSSSKKKSASGSGKKKSPSTRKKKASSSRKRSSATS